LGTSGRHLSLILALSLAAAPGCASDDADEAPAPDAGLGGAGDADAGPPPVDWCEGATRQIYELPGTGGFDAFPDDHFTRADPTSATGLRVDVSDETAPWVKDFPPTFAEMLRSLSALDGWGTTAGAYLRFSGPLAPPPTGEDESLSSEAVMLLDLGGEEAERVPYEARLTDDHALIVWPMRPLRPATRHGLLVTRAHKDAAGDCISPSRDLRGLLGGERHAELLAKSGVAAADVSGALVFTTQTIVERSVEVAADIATRENPWTGDAECALGDLHRRCDRTILARDYRGPTGVDDASPDAEYDLPVRVWLPLSEDGPWPTVIFAHGLSGDRSQAKRLADRAAPLGMATVAVDAVAHGDHPAGTGGHELMNVLQFFGIHIAEATIDGLAMRDNWRQSTYDKLQLLNALGADPDVDGDGVADLDTEHIAFLGASLGGAMGPELLALTDDIGVAILSVAGGRVASIIEEGETFSMLVQALKPEGSSQGLVDRFFPVLQTLVEAGDASNYAPHILRDRLPGAGQRLPHLLMAMAINDDTVPPVSNRSLARALGVPHAPPIHEEVGLLPRAPEPPFAGNLAEGTLTAALFQFVEITDRPGAEPEVASHDNVSASEEGILQATHFMRTWLDQGVPEIIDPHRQMR